MIVFKVKVKLFNYLHGYKYFKLGAHLEIFILSTLAKDENVLIDDVIVPSFYTAHYLATGFILLTLNMDFSIWTLNI